MNCSCFSLQRGRKYMGQVKKNIKGLNWFYEIPFLLLEK